MRYKKYPLSIQCGIWEVFLPWEGLPLKKCSIVYYIKSTKHSEGKKKLQQRQADNSDIAQCEIKCSEDVHKQDKALPEQQQVL